MHLKSQLLLFVIALLCGNWSQRLASGLENKAGWKNGARGKRQKMVLLLISPFVALVPRAKSSTVTAQP